MMIPPSLLFLSLFLFFSSFAFAAAQCPQDQAGLVNWSSSSSGMPTPSAGASLTIPAGSKILLDLNVDVSAPLDSLIIEGTLVVDPARPVTNLMARNIVVRAGGKFFVGSAECFFPSTFSLTLLGTVFAFIQRETPDAREDFR